MKTKEIYVNNKDRKYCAVSEIQEENVKLESTPLKTIKNNPLAFGIGALIIVAILFFALHNDLRAFLIGVRISRISCTCMYFYE